MKRKRSHEQEEFCEWEKTKDGDGFNTSCTCYIGMSLGYHALPRCPKCGKRIKVKEPKPKLRYVECGDGEKVFREQKVEDEE